MTINVYIFNFQGEYVCLAEEFRAAGKSFVVNASFDESPGRPGKSFFDSPEVSPPVPPKLREISPPLSLPTKPTQDLGMQEHVQREVNLYTQREVTLGACSPDSAINDSLGSTDRYTASGNSSVCSPDRASATGSDHCKQRTMSESDKNDSIFKVPLSPKDPYGLKVIEKKINSNTWKKKKSDNFIGDLPNADETSKSLEAVRALLNSASFHENPNSSVMNYSNMESSVMEESYVSHGNRTLDRSWKHRRDQSFCSAQQSDDEGYDSSVWVRRDADTSRSEPELSRNALSRSLNISKSKVKSDGKSFLPIKSMKKMFTSNKATSKKMSSSMSLSISKDSLFKINKLEAFEKENAKLLEVTNSILFIY